ncbi:hypothetical protein PV326_010446 [Microctonus aethiopoides]|nr:hypothetical protein PV326_010446 [Microctonus aethiopoides]
MRKDIDISNSQKLLVINRLTMRGFLTNIFDHKDSNYGVIVNSLQLEYYSESEEIEVKNNVLADPDYLPEESIASDDSFVRRSSRLAGRENENLSQESDEYSSPEEDFNDADNDNNDYDADTEHDNDDADDDDDDDNNNNDDLNDCSIIEDYDNAIMNSPNEPGPSNINKTVAIVHNKKWKRCRPLPQTSSDDSDIEIIVPATKQNKKTCNEEMSNTIVINLDDDEEFNSCQNEDSDETLFEFD